MKSRKNLVWLCLIAALLVGIALTNSSQSSPSTVVYVDPKYSTKPPGETFDIYVTASEVPVEWYLNLFMAEFYMSFDPAILAVVDDPATTDDVEGINPGDVGNFTENILIEEVDNEEGWLHVVAGRPLGVTEGLSGTVQMAKITFLVEAEGSCDLHFYDSPETPDVDPSLLDVKGNALEHTAEDGYFSPPFQYDVAILSVTSPSTVKTGDSLSITVVVENQGTKTESFDITVYYDNSTIETETVTNLEAGAKITLMFTWDTAGVDIGRYTIKAEAEEVEGETDTYDNVRTGGEVKVQKAAALGIPWYAVAVIIIVIVAMALVYGLHKK